MFKLIISPEFGERIDLTRLVRDVMNRMEADLSRQLEWVAVAHFNTEHAHAHIALRGVADGEVLRLDRDYVKHGVRKHAEEGCTAQLGFRTRADALEAQQREIDQPRLTSLDRQIARNRPDQPPAVFRVEIDPAVRPTLGKRLLTLERLGLAQRISQNEWDVDAGFDSVLRTMQNVTDRQRMVAAHAELLSNPRLPTRYTPTTRISDMTGRVIAHRYDDVTGRAQMILEGADGYVHIIPHDTNLERLRSEGALVCGHSITLKRSMRKLSITDHGDPGDYMRSVTDPKRGRDAAIRQSRPQGAREL